MPSWRAKAVYSLLVTGAGLLLALTPMAWTADGASPVARILAFVSHNNDDPRQVLKDLWSREGYGSSAHRIVEEYPITGTGPGSFHILVVDYSNIFADRRLQSDNAQNWVRHLFAEMGILGSAGCLAWILAFLVYVGGRGRQSLSPASIAILGALVGLALASMVGVPTQNVIVLITFWTFVFWFVQETAIHPAIEGNRASWLAWAAVALLVAAFGAATLWVATTRLRVPYRAQRAGWAYNYGFHRLDHSAGDPFRWTQRRAVAVFPARPGFLRLNYWVHHPDVSSAPVTVRVWRDRELVVEERLADQVGRTAYLYNRGAQPWMMLTLEVDRTWQPEHENRVRELGVGLTDWAFVTSAPPGARVIP